MTAEIGLPEEWEKSVLRIHYETPEGSSKSVDINGETACKVMETCACYYLLAIWPSQSYKELLVDGGAATGNSQYIVHGFRDMCHEVLGRDNRYEAFLALMKDEDFEDILIRTLMGSMPFLSSVENIASGDPVANSLRQTARELGMELYQL